MTDPMRLLIVDDEPLALRRLALALLGIPDVEIVGSAQDGDTAIAEARRLRPDLIILDVEMPGRDGIAVAAELDQAHGAEVIIISAFDRYATSAFEVEAIDYLLKPLRPDRLRQAVQRARRRREERVAHSSSLAAEPATTPTLHVPDRHGGRDVAVSEITWIEAARDYALLHTRTRSHILRITMSELASRLPDTMLRAHRSAFVNLGEVRRWGIASKGTYSLILSDETEVPVGPSYIEEVRLALRSLGALE